MFYGNTKYFFLYLSQTKNPFNFFWISGNKEIIKELRSKNLPVVYLYSFKGVSSIIRSNFLIISHGIRDVSFSFYLPGKFKKIHVNHGAPFKKSNLSVKYSDDKKKSIKDKLTLKELESFHTLLATYDEAMPIITSEYNNKNVKLLGFPRNDVFF